ncbi:hypothetical protein [Carnobacterium antarcticum]|uniref:T4 recombination endonuclease VII dimerisation domain-containing protein n=1 Tax=Carnobacterium antarcticum TaxID=2126436 RepID=A0ABW4NPD1_9LACT|nr:hypothetical protein [Carnobacterium sp. CP1]ALV20756.1 hypothetical protein NY10_131 [Carnobacterium sp. CP1]
MIVKVKDMPVSYEGERYEKGKELEIKKEYHNDALFLVVKETSDIDKPEDLNKLKKEELQALLDEKGIEYEAEAAKKDLLVLLEDAK